MLPGLKWLIYATGGLEVESGEREREEGVMTFFYGCHGT